MLLAPIQLCETTLQTVSQVQASNGSRRERRLLQVVSNHFLRLRSQWTANDSKERSHLQSPLAPRPKQHLNQLSSLRHLSFWPEPPPSDVVRISVLIPLALAEQSHSTLPIVMQEKFPRPEALEVQWRESY